MSAPRGCLEARPALPPISDIPERSGTVKHNSREGNLMADYTMTEYTIISGGVGVSLLIAFTLPLGWLDKAFSWLFASVLWVVLAVVAIVLVGLTVYPIFGWLATIPSWAAVIIVLLVLIYLKN
jgi:hypothetical protein